MKVRLGPDLSLTTTDPKTGLDTWHGQIPDLINSKPDLIDLVTPELVLATAKEFPELKPALMGYFPDAFENEAEAGEPVGKPAGETSLAAHEPPMTAEEAATATALQTR